MSLTVALTPRGWGVVAGAAASGLLWQVVELHDLRYLVALLVAMLVVAMGWVALIRFLAEVVVSVSVSDTTPGPGDRIVCSAFVRHRLHRPLDVAITWDCDTRRMRVPLTVLPERGGRSRIACTMQRRGPATVRVTDVAVPDPLGLMVRRVRARPAAVDVLVVPRPLAGVPDAVPAAVTQVQGQGGRRTSRAWPGDPGAPAGLVREYRQGDGMRHVHWKQSARQGKLLMNQYDGAQPPEARLFLVTSAESYPTSATFERAVSATVTVAQRYLADGVRLRLRWGDVPGVTCVSEEEVLYHLAFVAEDRGSDAGTAVRNDPGGNDTVITGDATEHVRGLLQGSGFAGDLVLTGDVQAPSSDRAWRETRVLWQEDELVDVGRGDCA
ncbi:DUF58 domain-containing protein [Corynebacterium glyciniphilum]|uniref:DUF58 domain-containing protein n=1 Tax=Corynebacterium glyciniphilum TaxID=1404244 RepID=UPI003D9FD3B6